MLFFTKYEELCREKHETPTGVALKLGVSRGAVNKWRNGATPNGEILSSVAEYFGVSVDYLLGKTKIRNAPDKQSPEDIAKVALFGGDGEVTDEMWEEVKGFVEYVKTKHMKGN